MNNNSAEIKYSNNTEKTCPVCGSIESSGVIVKQRSISFYGCETCYNLQLVNLNKVVDIFPGDLLSGSGYKL